jgi:hypothetical protein
MGEIIPGPKTWAGLGNQIPEVELDEEAELLPDAAVIPIDIGTKPTHSTEELIAGFIEGACRVLELCPAHDLRTLQDLMREAKALGLSNPHIIGALEVAFEAARQDAGDFGGLV